MKSLFLNLLFWFAVWTIADLIAPGPAGFWNAANARELFMMAASLSYAAWRFV